MRWFADRLSETCGIPAERLLELSAINEEKVASWKA